MATLDEIALQVNANTETINAITTASKNITDFDAQIPLVLTSEIPVANSGADEKITAQQIIDEASKSYNVASKVTDYQSLVDDFILSSASTVEITITLPTAVGNIGKEVNVKRIDSTIYDTIVDTLNSETIDGNLTQSITKQYTTMTVISDGANWFIK